MSVPPSTNVVLLFGGTSGERRVSVASAQHIAAVLPACDAWYVAPDGRVFDCPLATLAAHARPFETDLVLDGAPAFATLADAVASLASRDVVALLGFHGGEGEDGTVQRMLELHRVAFTGSGSAASARAFDKAAAKRVARDAGVQTADAMFVDAGDRQGAQQGLRALVARYGRAVAKPAADGSSVGLFHVRALDECNDVAAEIAARNVGYLLEAFITGTELTVGVVDRNGETQALCASEVRLDPGRAFDFEGKYLGKGTVELTPAQVPPEVSTAACVLAVTMHRALGCEGYSRTDVIATSDGPVFLETNTLPGMTRASFLPQQLAHVGTTMRAFLDAQIDAARIRRDAAR